MVNYANSKVYKIWSTQGDKIYVGSTNKQYLSQRMDKHRSDYKRWKDGKCRSITSFKLFDEYGLENCFIELIEAKECNSKDELLQLEGKYIRELECVNRFITGRTTKEWREDNKETIKQWRTDHKEYLDEYYKNYYENNKEAVKQHYQDNKEQILENKKKYREDNQDKLKEIRNCECGSKYRISNKSYHLKTVKHCKFIESQIIKPEVDEV